MIAFALGAILLLGWIPAHADEPVTPTNFPPCTVMVLPEVGQVCVYRDIEDWKRVLVADAELTRYRGETNLCREAKQVLEHQVSLLEHEKAVLIVTNKDIDDENARLTKELIALDKKYQEERVKPSFGPPVPWVVAGLASSILAGVLISSALN